MHIKLVKQLEKGLYYTPVRPAAQAAGTGTMSDNLSSVVRSLAKLGYQG